MPNEQKGFETLPSRTAFYLGLAGGVLGICTLGFFILIGGVFSGAGFSLGKLANGAASEKTVKADVQNLPSQDDTDIPSPSATPPPAVTKDDHIRGDAKAEITLVEYSDFECPFCKQFHGTMTQIVDGYKGKVRWVYRHFPLSFHANAQKEAEASECAADLGGNEAFWKYSDAIFSRTTSNGAGFALDALIPLAKEIGLDEGKFKTCLDSGKFAGKVKDEMSSGSLAGVSGTPGTFVITSDGKSQLIPGALPFESMKQIIDGVLQ